MLEGNRSPNPNDSQIGLFEAWPCAEVSLSERLYITVAVGSVRTSTAGNNCTRTRHYLRGGLRESILALSSEVETLKPIWTQFNWR